MSEFEKNILLVFLKSMLEIETVKLSAIRKSIDAYGYNVSTSISQNVCKATIAEIKRQTEILSKQNEPM